MRRRLGPALLIGAVAACGDGSAPGPGSVGLAATRGGFPGFEDVTEASGVRFVHDNGATDRRYLPETMGAGVAVFDFDGDGRPDLFFVGGAAVEGPTPAAPGALYRNLGAGRFVDATERAGLSPGLLGMAAATADVERDGDVDLVVTGVGGDLLFRNQGDGTFGSGEPLPVAPGFGVAAAFLDADGDGLEDLFLARYVEWSRESDVPCRSPSGERIYCTPEAYPPVASRLLRNRGEGVFEDATAGSGLLESPGKALGVLPIDADGDDRLDVAVANDTTANQLFLNRGAGRFEDEAVARGFAFGQSGAPRGGMGIDGADFDGDGATDVVIGNFALESSALFGAREGLYLDVAAEVGLGLPSLVTLAFGTLAEDLDGNGWPDLLLVNGHIEPRIAETYPSQSYRQVPLLLLHTGARGSLREAAGGAGLTEALVGRGAATGDLDGDGAPDLVLTENGGPARLYRNRSPGDRWLAVRSRTPAYGLEAEVELRATLAESGTSGGRKNGTSGHRDIGTSGGGRAGLRDFGISIRTIRRRLVSGRSYLSSPEPVIRIGTGGAEIVTVTLRWPDGRVVRYGRVPAATIVVE